MSAPTVGLFTASIVADDGTLWAIYLKVETYEQAEALIAKLGLRTDKQGVCRVVEEGGVLSLYTNTHRILN